VNLNIIGTIPTEYQILSQIPIQSVVNFNQSLYKPSNQSPAIRKLQPNKDHRIICLKLKTLLYNIFSIMNISNDENAIPQVAEIFSLLGQPARLQLFLAIGTEKVCVCQLEKLLNFRQAYASQQLMLMREAGLVETERVGRHIFYYIPDLRWLDIIKESAALRGINLPHFILPEISDCEYKP
jgi:DNA-binding transcriptional ArsR family regulator